MKRVSLDISKLKNKQWYHQRFDGCPMFLYAVGEAEVKREKRKPTGTEADVRMCFFSHGEADWYLDIKDIKRGAEKIISLAKQDQRVSTKLLEAWREDEKRFERFFWKEFPQIDLKKLSDGQLIALWNRYYQLFINRFTSSAIIDHFALGTDETISKMLKKELEGAGFKFGKRSEFTNLFSVATAPVHQSFINEAEINLLRIATGKSKMTVDEYQRRYFWSKNNYVIAQELSVEYFKKEIQSRRKSGNDLAQELKKMENTPKINKRKKIQLLKRYKFSKLLKTLLKISEDFTWWQDERKKSTYFNIHIGTKILAEIGKRERYDLEELKYAIAPEITGIAERHDPTRKELRARRGISVLQAQRDSFAFETEKNKVAKIKNLMLGSLDYGQQSDVRGLTASLGKALGTARVLKSATEVTKVKKGDILIAVMTRPDYVTAMKKAAAIVTDEGGITSHAAIVSRELGVPCIIGTKIATLVFKDGDTVEVNANHGWARKVNI